jgi:UDP-N-acetylmuramyl pentapeptide phosphotransferase/UDP-N-acetylglucosamine-1-phosphate transferase
MQICIIHSSSKDYKKKKLKKAIIGISCITASIIITQGIFPSMALADAAKGINAADRVGYEVWKIIKIASRWIMIGLTAKGILQALNEHDKNEIGKVVIKYLLAYAVIASLINIFNWIDKLVG